MKPKKMLLFALTKLAMMSGDKWRIWVVFHPARYLLVVGRGTLK